MGHESFFSYSITRPFPFRWFTPVAVVGGIVFIALFSFLNFASSSYELNVQSSLNPNDTLSGGSWLHHWPSFLTTKIQPKCQPRDLPVNSQFFTNQTALTYTLTSVWQQHETGGNRIISPSLTYYSNVLQNCSVTSVEVDLAGIDRSGNQVAFSEWGAVLRSYVTCRITTPTGVVLFNLTQTYDYIPDTTPFGDLYKFLGTGFLSRNQTSRASLWWGESLMSTYWGAVTWIMQQERENKTRHNEAGISKGTISFTSNESFSDIQDLQFFNVDYRFIVDLGDGNFDVVCCPNIQAPLSAASLTAAHIYPFIWSEVDTLAKAVYSTVLADLGQTTAASSILTDASLLSHFTSNFSHIAMANFKSGPANESFSTLRAMTGPLGTTPSVISTTYICQVPRLKPAGSLFVAILVADLVLLQAVWQLYKLLAEAYLTRQEPGSNLCQRCLGVPSGERPGDPAVSSMARRDSDTEYHPLVDVPSSQI